MYKNKPLFFQLCSALDVISDTEEAILAFRAAKFESERATLYLAVYGLLQAIDVQQDAVINLSNSLGLDEHIKNYPRLNKIREIRNDSVGHPTKRNPKTKGGPTSYHFISQRSLNPMGFDIISIFSDGSSEHRSINTPEIMLDQQKYIVSILDKIKDKLEQEERAHKEKFRMEKLRDIFHPTTHYYFEKVTEAIHGSKPPGFGAGSLENIHEVVTSFREAVKRRDEAYYESLHDDYDLIEFAVSRLQEFFQSENWSEEEIKSAKIFNIFLYGQVRKLQEYAQEIDDDYAENIDNEDHAS